MRAASDLNKLGHGTSFSGVPRFCKIPFCSTSKQLVDSHGKINLPGEAILKDPCKKWDESHPTFEFTPCFKQLHRGSHAFKSDALTESDVMLAWQLRMCLQVVVILRCRITSLDSSRTLQALNELARASIHRHALQLHCKCALDA
eukprot:6475905-Amphidinium_carterae.1